jgi:DNA-binding LacI/PurR family transcriptional regulator
MPRNFMQPHKRMEARRRIEAEIRSQVMWGQRLAGERELAARLGIGRNTVRAAMAELEMAGMLDRRVGAGTFVRLQPGKAAGGQGRPGRLALVTRQPVEAIPEWIFEGRLLRAILGCAPQLHAECQVLVGSAPGARERLSDRGLLRQFDGFVSVGVDDRELLSRLIELRRGPVVLLNGYPTCLPLISVVDDGFSGSRAVTRHLIRLGHRRVAFLNCHAPENNNPDKIAGYRAALTERGWAVDERLVCEAPRSGRDGGWEAFAARAAGELLDLSDPPTAILGFDDLYALPALRALERRGLRIGKDFSVAGQGDNAARQGIYDRLTSTRINFDRMAAEAVRAALAGAAAAEGRTVIVPNRLVVRGSTCPPRERRLKGAES